MTNSSDSNLFQLSLRHALISASVADDIGMPKKVIVDNFQGYKVEFTRQGRTYSMRDVSIELTSLKHPLTNITSSVGETLYLKKCHSLLKEEKYASRKKHMDETEKRFYSAMKALETKRMNLSYIGEYYLREWDDKLALKYPHLQGSKPVLTLVNTKNVYTLPNVYRHFWYFQVLGFQMIDFHEFMSSLMKGVNFDCLYDYRYNPEVYDVDQREFAVVLKGKELGTTKIRQCVAVVIQGKQKVALAHVDSNTRQESLEREIMRTFPCNESVKIQVYGPTQKVLNIKSDMLLDKIANDNISVVLQAIESLRSRGYKVDIASIHANACIEKKRLEKLEFQNPVFPAEWEDIITDGDKIYQDTNPPTNNPFIALRKMIRYIDNDWAGIRTKQRILELNKFNIDNFPCIDKFIKDNPQCHFHLSEEDLREYFLTMTDAILEYNKALMENLECIAELFSCVYQTLLICTKQDMSERWVNVNLCVKPTPYRATSFTSSAYISRLSHLKFGQMPVAKLQRAA